MFSSLCQLGESKDFRDSTENSQEQARAALLKRSLRILVTKLELYREVRLLDRVMRCSWPSVDAVSVVLAGHDTLHKLGWGEIERV